MENIDLTKKRYASVLFLAMIWMCFVTYDFINGDDLFVRNVIDFIGRWWGLFLFLILYGVIIWISSKNFGRIKRCDKEMREARYDKPCMCERVRLTPEEKELAPKCMECGEYPK
jgi:hypothetical protein